MQRLLALFALVFVCVFGNAVLAHAQLGGTSVDPLTVSVDPVYPAPYSSVTVTPSSTLFDIANNKITVSVNGTSIYKGSGGAGVPVSVGGPGTVTTITVTAVSSGKTYSKKVVLRPADVALVNEPRSTTHAFYAGRGLVSANSQVRLVAIPDIRTSANSEVSPDSLVYTWKLGNQILDSASGIGKQTLNATAPQRYRDATVSVTVATQDGSIVAQTATTISPVDPFVRIYKNDPLMGPLFDTALIGKVAMSDVEETYRAVPYYFASTPELSWTVNGSAGGSDQDITVRASGNGQGTANLGVTAKQSNPLITAVATVAVLFGQKGSTNFFGL